MFASAIASWAVLAKSLILISASPRASRWALMIIRRYLLTETPGIATGYWKAMKRPGLGALVGGGLGDVLALEGDRALGHLERRVAHDRVGERRLAGAVGPHQRVDLALLDVEVEALEDLLVLGAHVQVA